MSRIQIHWIVRTTGGQTKGPYTTEALLKLIGEGVFSGSEMVSRYPGGQWSQLSQEPQFYDKLLEALEGSVEPVPKSNAHEETIVGPVPEHLKNPQAQRSILEKTEVRNSTRTPTPQSPLPKPHQASHTSSMPGPIIELKNIAQAQKQEFMKSSKLPLILVAVALLLVVYVLLPDGPDAGEKISLLAPSKGSAAMSDSQIKDKLSVALKAIEADTIESYLDAQNNLVAIVEGSPSNLEVRGLLCLVYKELWPFAKQDAADVRAVSSVTQSTRALNAVGLYGSICEIVNLQTSGHYKEARGVAESALESAERFSLLAVLYQFKAELLEADKDYMNATPYYDKAAQLWDTWLRPQVKLGAMAAQQSQGPKASQYLRAVLAKNPGHREAKIRLGILEYKAFKQDENAFKFLKSAMSSDARVERDLEALGYYTLAELHLAKSEKSAALTAAQNAYRLSPNNGQFKQMVVRLGGSDKLKEKSTNSEMMFIGDQYARSGDCLAAQAEYKAAFELEPKNGMAAVKAAKCLWQLNQSFEAIEWLTKAIKADPSLITAYVLQADYMSQRYNFLGATNALTNAARVSPNNYEVLRGMALIEFRRNNFQGAVNFAQRALRAYDADIDTYTILAKSSASLYASTIAATKKDAEARETYQRDALRFATKAVEIDATNTEGQITYAKVMAQINGIDSGVNYLQELIKKYSYSVEYRVALAEIYRAEERYAQAKEYYEQVTEADPKNKKAFIGLGESYKALGLIEPSLRAFLSAAVLDPSDAEALFQVGKLRLESNQFDKAIEQFKRVQTINPQFPRAAYFIGKAAMMAGNYNLALEAVKKEKQANPNLADSYLLAGEIFNAKKQFAECAAEYSQAMKLHSQGADIYVKAAQCYRQSGSVDIAQDLLSMASARESGYADIYKEQGAIYEIRGDIRAAVQSYNKYLGLSPNAPDRGEIEARINRIGGG
ncbi:tetratricopeptide repeat protein [Bdellovibrio sp. HCB337]|uniref:tetratricopeptide repeat protein n=1 Tax=Bdellovibrio sp. HCB337 TaxID=3394358 RepID=UPI0039A763DD